MCEYVHERKKKECERKIVRERKTVRESVYERKKEKCNEKDPEWGSTKAPKVIKTCEKSKRTADAPVQQVQPWTLAPHCEALSVSTSDRHP